VALILVSGHPGSSKPNGSFDGLFFAALALGAAP
jgi:hypothetical protein